jgi:hypothetical protein
MKNIRRITLLAAALGIVCALQSARGQSTNWTITLNSGETIDDASVVGLHDDSLLVSRGGFVRVLPLDALATMHRVDGTHMAGGILAGTGIGLLAGVILDGFYISSTKPDGPDPMVLVIPLGSIVGGGVIGATIGGSSKNEWTYDLASMSANDRRKRLEVIASWEGNDSILTVRYAGENVGHTRNNIYLEFFGAGVFYSLNYEILLDRKLAARIGIEIVEQGVVEPMTITYLVFDGPGHLELGAGVVSPMYDRVYTSPVLSIGYRYQPARRGIFFNVGFHFLLSDEPAGGIFEKGAPIGMGLGYSF